MCWRRKKLFESRRGSNLFFGLCLLLRICFFTLFCLFLARQRAYSMSRPRACLTWAPTTCQDQWLWSRNTHGHCLQKKQSSLPVIVGILWFSNHGSYTCQKMFFFLKKEKIIKHTLVPLNLVYPAILILLSHPQSF